MSGKTPKRLALAAFLLATLLGGAGCGSNSASEPKPSEVSKPRSLLISWSGDGNPLVPVCNGATLNCKKDLTVLDKTTGVAVTVPLTASSYTAPNANDSYAVQVNGFDGEGNSISSAYEDVPSE